MALGSVVVALLSSHGSWALERRLSSRGSWALKWRLGGRGSWLWSGGSVGVALGSGAEAQWYGSGLSSRGSRLWSGGSVVVALEQRFSSHGSGL